MYILWLCFKGNDTINSFLWFMRLRIHFLLASTVPSLANFPQILLAMRHWCMSSKMVPGYIFKSTILVMVYTSAFNIFARYSKPCQARKEWYYFRQNNIFNWRYTERKAFHVWLIRNCDWIIKFQVILWSYMMFLMNHFVSFCTIRWGNKNSSSQLFVKSWWETCFVKR